MRKKNVFFLFFEYFFRILSEDDLHLLELPEPPPVIINKNDNRSSISSGSAITSDPKASATKATNKSQQPSTYQQSQSSIICENDNPHEPSTSPNEKNCINNVKNIIHKLQCVSISSSFFVCFIHKMYNSSNEFLGIE